MFGSLDLGQIFGIRIRVSWAFVFLLGLLVLTSGSRSPIALLPLAFLLMSVLLHELGHSLMAQSFGIRVLDITFWPLGGMARMSDIPEDSRTEAAIAIAGPAVNFGLAALALPLMLLPLGPARFTPDGSMNAAGLVFAFIAINLSLGLFNLLPAFPMDGGRLLRAFLARRGSWVQATEHAVRVGRWLALAMVIFGLLYWGRMWLVLPFIGLFVWFAGAAELAQVRLRHGLDPIAGRPLFGGMRGAPFGAAPFGNGADAQPAEATTERAAEAHGNTVPRDGEEHASGARRPQDWVVESEPDRRRGFSAADLERLERYRGPLRRGSD